jgi:ADP-ribose pyrophosphatase YjhB (NUDIX family)
MSFTKLSPEEIRLHKGTSFTGAGTVFFCHDGKGKFLMSKRSQKCRDEKGRWEIAGGGLKWGITAEDNIKREVAEEFAANAQKIDFMGYRDVFRELDDGTPTHWVMLDFAVQVDPNDVKLNEPDMADELGWFTVANQPEPVHSQHQAFMKKYQKEIKEILKASDSLRSL